MDMEKERLFLGRAYGNGYLDLPELKVLHRLLRGMSYKEIADELKLSVSPIKYRLEKIKAVLDVDDMSALWSKVIAGGLVHLLSVDIDNLPRNYKTWFTGDSLLP